MPNTLLLAAHITIAIALTITVGVQSAKLAGIRTGVATEPAVPTLRAALWSTPILALLTFVTGMAVITDGGSGGPWVGVGVLSTLVIALASVWLLRQLPRPTTHRVLWWAQFNGVCPPCQRGGEDCPIAR